MLRHTKPRPQPRQEPSQGRLEVFPGIRMLSETLSLTFLGAPLAHPSLGSAPQAETLEPLIPSVAPHRAYRTEQIKVSLLVLSLSICSRASISTVEQTPAYALTHCNISAPSRWSKTNQPCHGPQLQLGPFPGLYCLKDSISVISLAFNTPNLPILPIALAPTATKISKTTLACSGLTR